LIVLLVACLIVAILGMACEQQACITSTDEACCTQMLCIVSVCMQVEEKHRFRRVYKLHNCRLLMPEGGR
jgi:energy-converting hydrogenase Eha subunit C